MDFQNAQPATGLSIEGVEVGGFPEKLSPYNHPELIYFFDLVFFPFFAEGTSATGAGVVE